MVLPAPFGPMMTRISFSSAIEGEIVDRLETVKGHGEAGDGEQKIFWLVANEHDLSPHSAGAPSATELPLFQPDFDSSEANRRSMRGCTYPAQSASRTGRSGRPVRRR